jgi:nucleoside phosphorylase
MLNVLIVDDDPKRFSFIENPEFATLSNQCAITLRSNLRDAIQYLGENECDLLIVDMAIPSVAWSTDIKLDGGIQLLKHFEEDEALQAPAFVIGITASSDRESDVIEYFSNSHWVLINISQSGNDWHSRIYDAIVHAASIKNRESKITYGVDVCVITALADPEQRALLDTKIIWNSDPEFVDSNTSIRRGILKDKSDQNISIIMGCSSRMGSVEAALLSSKLIDRFRPKILAMAGICAGLEGKVFYGDPILANPVWDWTSSKWTVDEKGNEVIEPSPHYLECEGEIVSRFIQLKDDLDLLNSIRDDWRGKKPNTVLTAHCGPVASGPIVVADGRKLEEIKTTQNRQVLGLEMEAYGVYSAAAKAGLPRPLALSIKSVCDFADPRKNDEMQKYASYTSASILYQFLFRYGHEICAFAKN